MKCHNQLDLAIDLPLSLEKKLPRDLQLSKVDFTNSAEFNLLFNKLTDRVAKWRENITQVTDKQVKQPVKQPVPSSARSEAFISYSHHDKPWLDKLKTVLNPYVKATGIPIFDDTNIKPGMDSKEALKKALATAKVGILLVTPEFLASDFIATREYHIYWKQPSQMD